METALIVSVLSVLLLQPLGVVTTALSVRILQILLSSLARLVAIVCIPVISGFI